MLLTFSTRTVLCGEDVPAYYDHYNGALTDPRTKATQLTTD